jgi:hypothetical protein
MRRQRGVSVMGFIPESARWYIAGLIFEHTIDGDPCNVVHVNSHLVNAGSSEEAYRKANELGRAQEQEYVNTDGEVVRVTFRGLRDLDVIDDDLEDGGELFYEESQGVAEDDLRKWVTAKEALSVFAPRRGPAGGPNYLPAEFKALLKADEVSCVGALGDVDCNGANAAYFENDEPKTGDLMRLFMQSGQVDRLLSILRSARQRKPMYFQPVDVETAENFLNGFRVGSLACGIEIPLSIQERATNERGWKWNALGPLKEMRERGLDDDQIVDELFAIEIRAWEMHKG